ncbi:hypothetical protein F8M49_21810 [Rhodococcus zopfii]|uniref:TrbL/VirB6 plasmid conjugal transfer protein n=1 Tax=Rhodococcus zopfii TaxID=43772 RepID=A0ABU3WTC1_9NOCA|nr:hypothetical protein [Rhodococcus zopfii]MDV2477347.1 hypothetical protein [Rhodococcus zopfii]
MRTPTSRWPHSILVRIAALSVVLLTVAMSSGAIAVAQPAAPQTLEELSPEEKSWRDAQGVIWCSDHEFILCADLENREARGFRYPNDNTAYTALDNADGAMVNTEIDLADVPGRVLDEYSDSAFGKAAESVGRFAGDLLVESMVWWIQIDSIDISYANVLAGKTPMQQLVGFVMMAGILSGAIIMMVSRRTQPAVDILIGGVKYLLISALSMVVLKGAISAGDDFARQMIEEGSNEFGRRISTMLGASVLGNPAAVLILGLLTCILSFVQWVMGFMRQAGIVVLYALIILAAAGQLTTWGRQWFPRIAGMCVALVLFKPIAAMIYTIGYQLIGTDQSLTTLVTGIMVLALAVIALPALMKFFSFVGMQVGGGLGAGAGLAGVVAAGVGGAKAMNSIFGGGGGGGGDEHSSYMASTGPNGTAESDPSPGNTGGQKELTEGSSSTSGGTGSNAPQDGGEPEADLSLSPGTAENPDAAGDMSATDAAATGSDVGGAGGAAAGGAAAGGAAAGGAAAATGGASLVLTAGVKAIGMASDAVDSAADQMSPDDTGPDLN